MWQEKWCETIGKYEPGRDRRTEREKLFKNKLFSPVGNVF